MGLIGTYRKMISLCERCDHCFNEVYLSIDYYSIYLLQYIELPSVPDKKQEPETKQFVGLVIGILTTVIIMLLAAIMFIFYRNRRLKAALAPSTFYDQQADLKVN
ncbi:hypothetical protein HZH66_010103 [Vespula vulgaris]|uniref:Uncharacterized protein n=1 Tax=Vespula vulgaris TaxID=7454 RepID=A0A834JP50_VESVU|nr:hypothetical protein HZH66_010103 [Vespula vulgaris]